jgi:hypothetical protein
MERQGRDRSPLGLLERVVELDKVGELERLHLYEYQRAV